MLNGDLAVRDLPEAWNRKYQDDLGICPQNVAEGVLQDIHWSSGAIGYFPTYVLGNVYSAQFFAHATEDLGGCGTDFSEGQFEPLRSWLKQNIHLTGKCYSARELVHRVTGKELSHTYLVDYLKNKLSPLYGLS
jgi:carboxypeptidase Taq